MRWLSAALVMAGLLTGCGEKCDPKRDKPFCEGSKVVSCPEPGVDQLVGANQWVRHECAPHVCVSVGEQAFCALSTSPSARCADAGQACDDTTRVRCTQGFETSREPCLSCSALDGGGVSCPGGPSSACTSTSDCASPLTCSSTGFCFGPRDGGN